MGKPSCWTIIFTGFLVLAATTVAAPAQIFTTLASFDSSDGADPEFGALVQGRDGNFYGTTYVGGTIGDGTVFRVTPTGALKSLYSFCSVPRCTDGFLTWSGLVLATDGIFYGTTFQGGANGAGTLYGITERGKLTTLFAFGSAGAFSYGAPVQGTNGDLYGPTPYTTIGFGGIGEGDGTIYATSPPNKLATIHTFSGADGSDPVAPLVQANDGNFYGTTGAGGTSLNCTGGCGTVFKITPGGKLTTLHSFDGSDGSGPAGPLVQATDGYFYGTTTQGGTSNKCVGGCGTVFKIRASQLTTVHNFDGTDGSYPQAGVIQGTDGNLYGATEEGGTSTACGRFGCGTVFEITGGTMLTTLHIFEGPPDGSFPVATLLQSTNGNFYGTSDWGGTGCTGVGCGTIFSFSMGLGPFVTFVQRAAKAGQTAQILGQGFTGTSDVAFNGTPASFVVQTNTFLTATVPAGATPGYVTVTTPGRTLTSNVPFHVIP